MPRIEKVNLFQHQADAYLSQANPVSATLYTVLDTTKNVRIKGIATLVTWATTQPTPIDIIVTIDGEAITHSQANPVSNTPYYCKFHGFNDASSQTMDATDFAVYRSYLYEGRSVKVQIRITWATTQPTPLVCRVKYAKIP